MFISSATFTLASLEFPGTLFLNTLEQLTEFNGRRYKLKSLEASHGFSSWKRVALHIAQVVLFPLTILAYLIKLHYRIRSPLIERTQRLLSSEYLALSVFLDHWVSDSSEALQAIRKETKNTLLRAFVEASKDIDLSSHQVDHLDELPDCFTYFPFLKSINCSGRKLTSLPATLVNCWQLEELFCSNNHLTSLPGSLDRCAKLRHLDCSNNHLTSLPESLGGCTQLRSFNCANNHLSTLPNSLGRWTKLKHLDCSNNLLIYLPDNLAACSELAHLGCSYNRLTCLPANLGSCTFLSKLDCLENQLSFLPDSLGSCIKLEELSCSENQLTCLPNSLGHCTQLRVLSCRNNQLASLPDSLESCVELNEFDCSENQLMSLPRGLGLWKRLKALYCSLNILTFLPESLGDCAELGEFICHNNRLTSLPDSLGRCTKLTILGSSYNQLISLPDSLEGCTRLKKFYCSNNRLSSLSDSLIHLLQISYLDLSNNLFSEATLLQLQQEAASNTTGSILFSVYEPPVFDESEDLQTILARWRKEASLPEKNQPWRRLHDQTGFDNLRIFLIKLLGVADTKNAVTKQRLAIRICLFLEHAYNDEKFCELAIGIIEDALANCDDRVDLAFSEIECQLKISQAQLLSFPCELAKLAIGLQRLTLLRALAHEKMKSLKFVDETEVHLAYQLGLKEALKLPIEAQTMLYRRLSGITEDDLNNAKINLLQQTQSPESITSILVDFEPWQLYLENEDQTHRYKKIKEKALTKMETAREELESEAYLTEVKKITLWRKVALREFYLEDTRKWLEENPDFMTSEPTPQAAASA